MNFCLSLSDFRINTIIGILPKERKESQDIILDLSIVYSVESKIIDYAILHSIILDIFKKNHFGYLEEALRCLLDSILEQFDNIKAISLCLKKPTIFDDCIPSITLKWDKND
ncbi:dihydroneopterin aldolase [Helicobacter sp. MIT 14-3879]|uniref:dihydroneopterin aldolase n=1 Tax=Helicobacter sp. MIT 14-3879 TaxID=2040649 RepID=UPI000E1F822F|nr:dihydroneopterin aldolase [Helicobacter sp. MIT 14-3879]RDU62275.1 hypothetical protein CQA44_07215 [Helicobacter sp. MIT 14-3879]